MRKVVAFAFFGAFLSLPAAAENGQNVYDQQCAKCHETGLVNSPKMGDKAAWKPKVATGVDAMTASVMKGKGAMPPKGACPVCSDADLRDAVQYMAGKVR